MDLIKLTEIIVKGMVIDPDSVSVKEFETEEENTIQIEVVISKEDMGRIIGKDGKMINSIRTIVQAAASLSYNKKVTINVDSY